MALVPFQLTGCSSNKRKVQVIAAHDADRPGEEMAWRLAMEVQRLVEQHSW